MKRNPLNRPFVSYVLTQSMLVLIVMAASFLITDFMREFADITLNRFYISMGLVVFAQLPVAVMYARTETRNLTSVEGWALSLVFVGVTLAFEIVLQSIAGQKFAQALPIAEMGQAGASTHLAFWITGFVVGVIGACFAAKTVFGFAVRNNLSKGNDDRAPRLIDIVPGVNPTEFTWHRPKAARDYAELYRRELIGANIAIFGLSLMVFGPQFLHVLKLSIPLSFVFSLVCVANRMARVERTAALSQRCLNVAIQLLPLTVVSMGLLVLSTLYSNYVVIHGGERDVIGYFVWMLSGLGVELSALTQIATYLGLMFAICLAGNTLLLVLFARLIRPLVSKSFDVSRRSRRKGKAAARGDAHDRLTTDPVAAGPVTLTSAKELRVRSLIKPTRTLRPFAQTVS